ncbi:hypothetical protein ACFL0E_01120, partial [Nanoarchaeota archaeon]
LEENIPSIRREVSDLIGRKITDQQSIEGMLDLLLGFVPWDFGKEEFNKLNTYYSTIDPEAAKDYKRYYEEAISEE